MLTRFRPLQWCSSSDPLAHEPQDKLPCSFETNWGSWTTINNFIYHTSPSKHLYSAKTYPPRARPSADRSRIIGTHRPSQPAALEPDPFHVERNRTEPPSTTVSAQGLSSLTDASIRRAPINHSTFKVRKYVLATRLPGENQPSRVEGSRVALGCCRRLVPLPSRLLVLLRCLRCCLAGSYALALLGWTGKPPSIISKYLHTGYACRYWSGSLMLGDLRADIYIRF